MCIVFFLENHPWVAGSSLKFHDTCGKYIKLSEDKKVNQLIILKIMVARDTSPLLSSPQKLCLTNIKK